MVRYDLMHTAIDDYGEVSMLLQLRPGGAELISAAITCGPHTQESLAATVGCSQMTISRIARGKQARIRQPLAESLAMALNLKPSAIFITSSDAHAMTDSHSSSE